MKVSSILLQAALFAALMTSSAFAERDADNQHSKPDLTLSSSSSLSGSFDGSHGGHHHRGGILRDGSGSGLADFGSHDSSFFHDDDGSFGGEFPCGCLFGSYSGSFDSSFGSSSRHHHKRHFRGNVGDDYDFGSGDDDSDDSFDGSGSSSSGDVRCRRHRHRSGSGSEGSLAFYGDVGEYERDEELSGSHERHHHYHYHHHPSHGSTLDSGSGDSHRLRGPRSN